jgi:hypothetical protein
MMQSSGNGTRGRSAARRYVVSSASAKSGSSKGTVNEREGGASRVRDTSKNAYGATGRSFDIFEEVLWREHTGLRQATCRFL